MEFVNHFSDSVIQNIFFCHWMQRTNLEQVMDDMCFNIAALSYILQAIKCRLSQAICLKLCFKIVYQVILPKVPLVPSKKLKEEYTSIPSAHSVRFSGMVLSWVGKKGSNF